MADFGRTWWGQQWLAAFDGIDHSNRLPRGRRYANNGSVRAIDIGNTAVKARVLGSRPTPYKVDVALSQFSKEQRKTVLETAEASPALLSRLLNRQLPAHVLKLLEKHGIRLFPRAWRDLKARCSCPDSAVPCKHIAAVIYLLANEIDKNPFVVFALHGMDLAAELEQRAGVQAASVVSLPVLVEAWSDVPPSQDLAPPSIEATKAIDSIDLSRVPALESRICTILSPEPLFHRKDFRQILAAQYKRARREASLFDLDASSEPSEAERWTDLSAVIDEAGALVEIQDAGERLFKGGHKRYTLDPFEIFWHSCMGWLPIGSRGWPIPCASGVRCCALRSS